MEMPLPNPGGFSYYTVSRLAAEHVKVTLTGHGGDEVFAGYSAQFQTAFGTRPFPAGDAEPVPRIGRLTRAARFGARLAALGVAGTARRIKQRVRRELQTPEDLWISLHCARPPSQNSLLSRRLLTQLNGYSPIDDYISAFRSAPTDQMLDRCLYHDLRCYLPGLLYMEDRVSMSVSVESRVPLLDHRVVEFMATIPPSQKVLGLQPKALLRAAARNVMPEEIRNRRDKRPFPVPIRFWVQDALAGLTGNVLLSPQSLDRGIIDPDRLLRWDLSDREIWTALNLELWFRIFIDRDPVWTSQTLAPLGLLAGVGR